MSVMYKSDMDLRIGRGSEVQMSMMYKLDMDLSIGRGSESYKYNHRKQGFIVAFIKALLLLSTLVI